MIKKESDILLGFYGDDLTGSTDALESISRAGARTVLFFNCPSQEQLNSYQSFDAIGIAGMTRSMSPEVMETALNPAFEFLKKVNPLHVHYKVCSTFDSSPSIGSIGRAIDTGARYFDADFIPLLVAAPRLGRYCAFGNLFASMGIGSRGTIYRLDRHPAMRNHPITPSDESDLQLHLGKQTEKKIGLFDVLNFERPFEENINTLEKMLQEGCQIVLFDAVYAPQMERIGKIMNHYACKNHPLFSVGSSGIETALGENLIKEGRLGNNRSWKKLEKKKPILILSGSCSPVTAQQIDWALNHDFREVAVDPKILVEEDNQLATRYINQTISFLQDKKNVILHTCKGPKDSRIIKTNNILNDKRIAVSSNPQGIAALYGTVLGRIARSVFEKIPVERLVVAGGDTSGYIAQSLGIEAIEMIAPLVKGAPMCKAYAPGSPVDKIELNLKGGQVGDETYLGMMAEGKVFFK